MRILVHSINFHPLVGGLENVALMLCREFVRAGHTVEVVTATPGDPQYEEVEFEIRRGGHWKLLAAALKNADVALQFNPSLKSLPALALVRRPWVVCHHTPIDHLVTSGALVPRLKRFVCRFATNISCSNSLALCLGFPSFVVHSPYDASLFHKGDNSHRDGDLLVVARLVSDKGVSVAVQAAKLLTDLGRETRLTIVGEGPEHSSLVEMISCLGIQDKVSLVGLQPPLKVATLMRRHKTLVVPSVWREPFGIVALEGLASGCEVVASNIGGLPEAVSNFGHLFEPGSPQALAEAILQSEHFPRRSLPGTAAHLHDHQSPQIAMEYLQVLEQASQ